MEFAVGENVMVDTCMRRTCSEGGLWREEDLKQQCEVPVGCSLLTLPPGQCCLVCKGKLVKMFLVVIRKNGNFLPLVVDLQGEEALMIICVEFTFHGTVVTPMLSNYYLIIAQLL